jgi:hypothetical protein
MAAPALDALRRQRLTEVTRLLGLRAKRQLLRRRTNAIADAVNRACVVVLVAHLEGYVEDLVGDIVDELDVQGPATEDVPRILLAAHVAPEVEAIADITDRVKRADRIDRLFQNHSRMWLESRIARGKLQAAVITSDLGNPGAKEIARVLGLLGMSNVFERMQLPDGADAEKRVNEIVGIRNSIAHGGDASVGDQQVTEYVRSVEAVGVGLERAAASYVQQICRTNALPWS